MNCAHAHTEADYPNSIDPQGGWTDLQRQFIEADTGIVRAVFSKTIRGGTPYLLYHTTHLGWSYVYVADLGGPPASQVAARWPANTQQSTVNNPLSQSHLFQGAGCSPQAGAVSVQPALHQSSVSTICGPCLVQNVGEATHMGCDRDYSFGAGYRSFFADHPGLILVQDVHDP